MKKNYRINDKFASVDRLCQSIVYWPEKRRRLANQAIEKRTPHICQGRAV